jgi:hypothetical protein
MSAASCVTDMPVKVHSLHTRTLCCAGGGSVTFGAPMVLYGEDAPRLYASLQKVGASALLPV